MPTACRSRRACRASRSSGNPRRPCDILRHFGRRSGIAARQMRRHKRHNEPGVAPAPSKGFQTMRYTFLASFAATVLATAAYAQAGGMGMMRADTNGDGMISRAEADRTGHYPFRHDGYQQGRHHHRRRAQGSGQPPDGPCWRRRDDPRRFPGAGGQAGSGGSTPITMASSRPTRSRHGQSAPLR